jgi:hypothetical protein
MSIITLSSHRSPKIQKYYNLFREQVNRNIGVLRTGISLTGKRPTNIHPPPDNSAHNP